MDTGYDAETCKKMLREMYKNKPFINWDVQPLAYVMLKRIEIKNKLFPDKLDVLKGTQV